MRKWISRYIRAYNQFREIADDSSRQILNNLITLSKVTSGVMLPEIRRSTRQPSSRVGSSGIG
ncbi:hypothetical protein ACTXT7_010225 [Hymenolepis weldensis]